jgi:NADH-quinone oxidoreductase subunit E
MIDDRDLGADVTDSGFFGSTGDDGAEALDPVVVDLVDELVANAPAGGEGMLEVLLGVQDAFDRVSWRVQELVADRFGLSPAQVAGVVSFFPMLSDHRRGRLHLDVCQGFGCWLRGADSLIEQLESESSEQQADLQDPVLAVRRASCLGVCGSAPAVRSQFRIRTLEGAQAGSDLVAELLGGRSSETDG